MKRYINKPDYESNCTEIIEATENESIDLDTISLDEIMNAPDDTYFSCDTLDEYHEFLKKVGLD